MLIIPSLSLITPHNLSLPPQPPNVVSFFTFKRPPDSILCCPNAPGSGPSTGMWLIYQGPNILKKINWLQSPEATHYSPARGGEGWGHGCVHLPCLTVDLFGLVQAMAGVMIWGQQTCHAQKILCCSGSPWPQALAIFLSSLLQWSLSSGWWLQRLWGLRGLRGAAGAACLRDVLFVAEHFANTYSPALWPVASFFVTHSLIHFFFHCSVLWWDCQRCVSDYQNSFQSCKTDIWY